MANDHQQQQQQQRWELLLRLIPIQASQAKHFLSSRDTSASLSPLDPRSKFGLLFSTLSELRTLLPPSFDEGKEKETRQQKLEKFISWLSENGCKKEDLSNVYISKASEEEGDGVFAACDLKEGASVVKIPERVMMLASKAMSEDPLISSLITKDALLKQMPSLILALFLLNERRKGESSFWWPYIQILPLSSALSSTVFLMSLQHLQALQPSPAFEEALNIITTTSLQYAHVNRLIKEMDEITDKRLIGYGDFMWAMAVVSSRQNPIPINSKVNTLSLIPLFDMFNHSTGKITSFFDDKERVIECLGMKEYKKGEQVYIFYGERPNYEFLLFSGFVHQSNGFDHIKLKGIHLDDGHNETDRKKKVSLLEGLGVKPKKKQSVSPNPEFEFCFSASFVTGADKQSSFSSSDLATFARVNVLNKEELSNAKCLEGLKKASVTPLSAAHEDRALQFIQQLLEQQLKRYQSSPSEVGNDVKAVNDLISGERKLLESGKEDIEALLNKRKKQQLKRLNKKNKKQTKEVSSSPAVVSSS